jgi:hypothetical protein
MSVGGDENKALELTKEPAVPIENEINQKMEKHEDKRNMVSYVFGTIKDQVNFSREASKYRTELVTEKPNAFF